MTASAAELLRLLGSGVRPVDAPANARGPVAGADFGVLLRRAASGELTSGRVVRTTPATEGSLTDAQLGRLSTVADAAEAAGATRLAVAMDGVLVEVDIASREATSVRPAEEAGGATPDGVMTGVDAVVILPTEGEDEETRVGAAESAPAAVRAQGRAPALHAVNPAVAELLAGMETRRSA
jgi:hypothetical protein